MEVNNFVRLVKEYFDEKGVKIILDIGSRYGNQSISLRQAFPNSKIYAFECNLDAIKVWRNNVEQKDIYLVEKAVSDVDGTIEFYPINPERTITTHKDGNIGASSLLKANPEYPYEKYSQDCIKVQSTTIDAWAKENDTKSIDLIWIDLQGAELRAFAGMENTLKSVKMIHTEIAFKPVYIGQPLFRDINAFLRRRNFLFIGFENVSGWFGDANYVNANYLSAAQKWRCRSKQLLNLVVDFKHHKRRLRQYFA